MTITKKWLPASLGAVLIATVLTGCPAKEESTASMPADQAVKAAYPKMWSESYNYEGYVVANIREDASALIGTQGGLSAEDAESELELVSELRSREGQQTIAMLNSGRLSYKGAFDNNNMKSDIIVGVDYEQHGVKMSLEVPMMIDFNNDLTLYIDPKAAKAFMPLPPALDGKLIKLVGSEIPMLTPEQRNKFKSANDIVKKFQSIATESFQGIDAASFKDIDLSDEAKKAGATRLVQLTLTPDQSIKMADDLLDKLLDTFGADFDLTASDIQELKTHIRESNSTYRLFMNDSVAQYGLNDNGLLVYMTQTETYQGAQHVGSFNAVLTMKDFGKPTFTVDPSKQESVSLIELMMMMGAF